MKASDKERTTQRQNRRIACVSQFTTRLFLVFFVFVGIFSLIFCKSSPSEDLDKPKSLLNTAQINEYQNNDRPHAQSNLFKHSFYDRDISPIKEDNATANDGEIVKITFIDVGQGEAILIQSPEGLYALIDGGDVTSNIVDYLMGQNIERFEIVFATHPHADHIGGLIDVLYNFPTKRVITNSDMHTTLTFETFLDAIAYSGSEYFEVMRGDEIRFGTLTFFVLNPGHLLANDLDQNSLVMRLSYGTTTFLFTGDATKETENAMISDNCLLKADILKVAHHGSRTSTTPEFLREVRPRIGVYSAGSENIYGHPHPENILTLEEAGVIIYGTDVYGSITFFVNKEGYRVEAEHSPQTIEAFH